MGYNIIYSSYNREPPQKISIGNYLGSYIGEWSLGVVGWGFWVNGFDGLASKGSIGLHASNLVAYAIPNTTLRVPYYTENGSPNPILVIKAPRRPKE